MTKFRKEGLAAELRSFSRLTVRLEYAQDGDEMVNDLIQLCIGDMPGAVADDSFVRRE
jgi:hypothetical protein